MVLKTRRMAIRRFTRQDAPGLHAVCGDPKTMRWVGDGMILSLARCEEWIDASLRDYATKGNGAWAVSAGETDDLLGYCGIVSAARRADAEIIYAFRPRHWRQGLAGELVPALLDYGLNRCRLPRLLATIAPQNTASWRAAERAGMHCAGEEVEPDGRIMLIYSIEAPWRTGRGD